MERDLTKAFEQIDQFVNNNKEKKFDVVFPEFRKQINIIGLQCGVTGIALFEKWMNSKKESGNIAH